MSRGLLSSTHCIRLGLLLLALLRFPEVELDFTRKDHFFDIPNQFHAQEHPDYTHKADFDTVACHRLILG